MLKFFGAALSAAVMVAATPSAATEVIGNLYMGVEGARMDVVSGHAVVNTWAIPPYQWSVAVAGDVRINANCSGCANPSGHQYTLGGVATGVTYGYPGPGIGADPDDSTSNGVSNFLVSFADGGVYKTDRDYTNATLLFTADQDSIGISYQAANNSLWVADWVGTNVTNYTMGGTVLSSFSTGHSENGGLAYNPNDNTLWLVNDNDGILEQYSLGGTLLGNNDLGGAGTGYVLGAEFDLGGGRGGAVPEPATWALMTSGFGLAGAALRRRRSAVAA